MICPFDKELKSDRLLLRRIGRDDINDIFEYTSNENNVFYLAWEAHKDKSNVTSFIEQSLNEYEFFKNRYSYGIELRESKKLIGVISIFDIKLESKQVEVSYILNQTFQGKGYASEALQKVIDFVLEDLNFIRVQAKCTEDNIASERIMEKCGLKYEGKLLKYWKIKGAHKNVLLYAKVK